MIDEKPYIDKAIEEILNPSFETTKQYLEVCEIEMQNGKPKVARVNTTYFEDVVAVYFVVKNEDYFIEVHLSSSPEIEVSFVYTQSGHRVYLTATSDHLCFDELSNFLPQFKQLTGCSKGDFRPSGNTQYTFSRVSLEPIKNEAYSLEEKLDLLLTELEKNREEVRKLSHHSSAIIRVCRNQYLSENAGLNFDIETIKRLTNLNLGIDIDTYLVGTAIKDE